ncbi:archease [bacterium]|nr:MAG: archease [bacterium]
MDKNYELIEHTADVGIRVKAEDLKGLFKNAALAMFDIIAVKHPVKADTKELKIEQNAVSLDELFINWLNELLSLSSAKELIFSDFKISEIDEKHLKSVVIASSNKNYKVNVEIKAATYHQLKIEKLSKGWQAEVIFDV